MAMLQKIDLKIGSGAAVSGPVMSVPVSAMPGGRGSAIIGVMGDGFRTELSNRIRDWSGGASR